MHAKSPAFTLVEILVAIAIIGILTGIGVLTVTGVKEDARKQKLEQDVVVANNAIEAFLLAGGSAAELTKENVITALKQRVGGEGPRDIVGPQGPFLDLTVLTNATDFEWGAVFTTSPSPRFYTAKTSAGVVFGHGYASAVGGVGERDDATRPEWVWGYGDATMPTRSDASYVPEAVDAADVGPSGNPMTVLAAPVITPGSLTTNLWGFPLAVVISNVNPPGSSRVYYQQNGGGDTLSDGTAVSVGPGTVLTAVAVSLDPSRYYNSGATSAEYQVIPFPLAVSVDAPSSITYAQAGGLMVGQAQQSPATATINLQNISQIPAPYLNSSYFKVRYTVDGSDPLTSGTAVTGPAFAGYYSPIAVSLGLPTWGTNSSLQVRAVAVSSKAEWFTSSGVASASITANQVTLDAPSITPPDQIVSPSVEVTLTPPGVGPVGMSLLYTTNGAVPSWADGIIYSNPFWLSAFGANEQRVVKGATVVSNNFMTNWFMASAAAQGTFIGAAGFGSSMPSGVLVGFAALGNSGTLRGSVVIARGTVQTNLILSGAAELKGNLYVPGTPRVYKLSTNAANLWSAGNDSAFSGFILGKEYNRDGELVTNNTNWSPSPRVVNLDGAVNPTNYYVSIQNSSKIWGKVFRRADTPELPTVAAPPAKANAATQTFGYGVVTTVNPNPPTSNPASFNAQSNSRITAKSGNYGKVTVSNEARLVLGDASNPEDVQYYTFESLEAIGSSAIEIVGKVVITINYSAGNKAFATSNSATVGNPAHPDWLQLNVYSSAAPNAATTHVNIGGAGSFYGRINAPKGLVKVGNSGSFRGAVTGYKMDMSGAGGADIEFDLVPVFE